MDAFLDYIWFYIEGGLIGLATVMDRIVFPLESLGPAWVILILALLTVALTRILAWVYRTRRHDTLKKEFLHWQFVRDEAVKNQDREKGKAMAKNIDQAKLNKVYYDYFFEGLMKNLITTVLPVLLAIAYLSRTYTKQTLAAKFGDPWIFTIGSESPIYIGTLFWYIICLIVCFTLFGLAGLFLKKGKSN